MSGPSNYGIVGLGVVGQMVVAENFNTPTTSGIVGIGVVGQMIVEGFGSSYPSSGVVGIGVVGQMIVAETSSISIPLTGVNGVLTLSAPAIHGSSTSGIVGVGVVGQMVVAESSSPSTTSGIVGVGIVGQMVVAESSQFNETFSVQMSIPTVGVSSSASTGHLANGINAVYSTSTVRSLGASNHLVSLTHVSASTVANGFGSVWSHPTGVIATSSVSSMAGIRIQDTLSGVHSTTSTGSVAFLKVVQITGVSVTSTIKATVSTFLNRVLGVSATNSVNTLQAVAQDNIHLVGVSSTLSARSVRSLAITSAITHVNSVSTTGSIHREIVVGISSVSTTTTVRGIPYNKSISVSGVISATQTGRVYRTISPHIEISLTPVTSATTITNYYMWNIGKNTPHRRTRIKPGIVSSVHISSHNTSKVVVTT